MPIRKTLNLFFKSSALALALSLNPSRALGHPIPFSYLDLNIQSGRIEGTLVVHSLDLAHDLQIDPPERLLDPSFLASERDRIIALLAPRLVTLRDGHPMTPAWGAIDPIVDRQDVRMRLQFDVPAPPGVLHIETALFPYDPNHQTFLNIYEHSVLAQQSILDVTHAGLDYYSGTRQGALAVIRRFVPAGIHHIAIGPDHILFLMGLLLLGGRPWTLLKIVTAFTLGHSLTLSLAALGLLSPPARFVEPAIALSIVYVGADNLLVTKNGRDVRAWIALFFGFVHGFGFAYVLKEFGLPRQALLWSLFSFNVGVEIGQLIIVVVAAALLTLIRRRSERMGRWVVTAGSITVMAAGAYWFIQRVFYPPL